jgi:hypothetical protein
VTFQTVKAQAQTQVNPVLACALCLFIGLGAPCLASHSLGGPGPNEFSDPIFRSHELSLALAAADEPGGGGASEETGKAEAKGGLSQEELAKLAQNPIANMISIPFQNNFNFGVGPNDVCQYVLNFQPVIPITLDEDWNLITRWITPIINQPSPAPGVRSAFGLGDINPSFFLSPGKPGKIIWGLGPTMTLPTATDSMLGAGKYSLGPSAVALKIEGHWLFGALVNNQWSVAGWGPKNQNNFLLQPFCNYNLPHGWYLTTAPIITADWNAPHRDMWTVPVGAGAGRIVKLGGKLPLNLQIAAYDNVCTPRNGADWQLRAQLQVLLPKEVLSHK